MASSVIGALRVNLGLDSAQFTKGVKGASSDMQRMGKQFAAVAAIATAAFTAITAAAMKGAQAIDANAKAARRIDATVAGYRALEMAADDAGVNIQGLANDVQTLNRELVRAERGEGAAGAALERLGLSAKDFAGLDADQRVALLADRVKDLGLTAGQTTLLLRDLGMRNREMALLVMGGGDALRKARVDVEEFGLAISDIDAARIEAANDEIAGLADVTTLLGDRLALAVVPALGDFARMITDSLRDGGLLRAVIDGLTNNLSAMVSIGGVAVTLFGVRYVAAMGLAFASTVTLTGALVALRTALVRTGVGALIVGAGLLVDQLFQLRQATGSWGATLSALGDLARGVWEGIKGSAKSLGPALGAVFQDIASAFFTMLSGLQARWAMFLGNIATGLRQLPFVGDEIADKLASTVRGIEDQADSFAATAARAAGSANALRDSAAGMASQGADQARAAFARLNEIMNGTTETTTAAADAARDLASGLDELTSDTGGGGGGGKSPVAKLADDLKEVGAASMNLNQSLAGVFTDAITGAKSLQEGLQGLLKQMASMFLNQAFMNVLGNIFPSFGKINFGGARAMGGPVASGRTYLVGEQGPELFTPSGSGQIVPNNALGGGASGGGTVVQVINNSGTPARQERSRGPDGRELVRVIVGEELAGGGFDRQMGGRFGVTPERVRR
jgi:hypothetical protein